MLVKLLLGGPIIAGATLSRFFALHVFVIPGSLLLFCAMLLCEKSIAARMWGYDAKQLAEIAEARENKKFLPGYKLPQSLVFEADDARIFAGADLVMSAVPCQFIRGVWGRLKKYAPADVPIVSVAKGIENKTLLAAYRDFGGGAWWATAWVKAPPYGNHGREPPMLRESRYVVLSGPTIADELARKLPATALAASVNEELAQKVQRTFNIGWLRVYTNTDIVGVELAGALKNVIAIAAGIVDGVGAGDNAKAALLSRGLAEIGRLGIAMGAQEKTFAGLSGLGDLVTTCISPKGRNRSFGEKIGKGQNAAEAQASMRGVVEGIATCALVVELAKKYNIEMPITEAVHQILFWRQERARCHQRSDDAAAQGRIVIGPTTNLLFTILLFTIVNTGCVEGLRFRCSFFRTSCRLRILPLNFQRSRYESRSRNRLTVFIFNSIFSLLSDCICGEGLRIWQIIDLLSIF